MKVELREIKHQYDYLKSMTSKSINRFNLIKQTNISSEENESFYDILYSICSEMFIERVNFKDLLFMPYFQPSDAYNEFSPNIFFTHKNEFGPF